MCILCRELWKEYLKENLRFFRSFICHEIQSNKSWKSRQRLSWCNSMIGSGKNKKRGFRHESNLSLLGLRIDTHSTKLWCTWIIISGITQGYPTQKYLFNLIFSLRRISLRSWLHHNCSWSIISFQLLWQFLSFSSYRNQRVFLVSFTITMEKRKIQADYNTTKNWCYISFHWYVVPEAETSIETTKTSTSKQKPTRKFIIFHRRVLAFILPIV